MANRTPIEWCRTYAEDGSFTEGYSVNPIRFRPHGSDRLTTMCQKVSPGCANCYAESIVRRFWPTTSVRVAEGSSEILRGDFPGYTALGVSYSAGEFVLDEKQLMSLLKIKQPAKVFWGDMTDLFGDWVKDEWLDKIFAVCALTPHLKHMFLTKRPERLLNYLKQVSDERDMQRWVNAAFELIPTVNDAFHKTLEDLEWPLPNVWLGVSVESQKLASERVPLLLQTPAAVRFLSCEPLLSMLDLEHLEVGDRTTDEDGEPVIDGFHYNALTGEAWADDAGDLTGECGLEGKIDWVIAGMESGPKARVTHPNAARSLRDQCVESKTPFFFKQWGEWAPGAQQADYSRADQAAFDRVDVKGNSVRFAPEKHSATDGMMYRVGKKAARNWLDGKQWLQFPEVPHG